MSMVENLVNAKIEALEKAERERAAQEHEERAAKEQRRVLELDDALRDALDPTFYYHLGLQIKTETTYAGDIAAYATFEYNGGEYQIWYEVGRFLISTPERGIRDSIKNKDELQNCIVEMIAEVEVLRAAREKRIHETQEILSRAIEKAADVPVWQWPDGVTIRYYTLTYHNGREEVEYYTATDRLDNWGYIEVYSTLARNSKKIVQLYPLAHKPIFEQHTASAAMFLPEVMRRSVLLELDDVSYLPDADENECYAYKRGAKASAIVGYEPVELVRELVERTAQRIERMLQQKEGKGEQGENVDE